MSTLIEVIEPGIGTTVQDAGRPGLAHIGVPSSGAVDLRLAETLNRLVGNPPDAALVETCGGLRLRSTAPVLVASDLEPVPRTLRPDEVFEVHAGGGRQWHYLAVRGGLATPTVLGSRSHDTLSGLGCGMLTAGATLAVGPEPQVGVTADIAPIAGLGDVARLVAGPRADWFVPEWQTLLTSTAWRVTTTSRVGVRLTGVAIARTITEELPSEGLVRGAIQIPPDGDPVMMLADHPTTGGYPVIAVVHPDDVAIVAQHPAGTSVRFRM